MATGIFGGSFDPVHHGHLIVAERAGEALGLDRVWFVPCARQPLKPRGPVASGEDRCAMLRLAIADHDLFGVETYEVERPGPSYTRDTLAELTGRAQGERFVLLLGADAAQDLPRWRSVDEVARMAEIAVLTRPGAPEVRSPYVSRVIAAPAVEISASDIRARCLTRKSIRYLVPDAVAEYIEVKGLYR